MKQMMTMIVALCWFAAASAPAATIELTAGAADAGALLRIPVPAGALQAKPGQVVALGASLAARPP